MYFHKMTSLLAGAVLMGTLAPPVAAQTAPSEESTVLEEIIVTARRRDELIIGRPFGMFAVGTRFTKG